MESAYFFTVLPLEVYILLYTCVFMMGREEERLKAPDVVTIYSPVIQRHVLYDLI